MDYVISHEWEGDREYSGEGEGCLGRGFTPILEDAYVFETVAAAEKFVDEFTPTPKMTSLIEIIPFEEAD